MLNFPITFSHLSPLDLRINWKNPQGAAFNLTGWTAKLQARDRVGGRLFLELSTANSGIILGGVQRNIVIYFRPPLTLKPFKCLYDFRLINPAGEWQEPMIGGPFHYEGRITV